jgi:orotate phosphoribosyltransferase
MRDLLTQLHELRDLLAEKSIRRGDFVLASGARSHYYCDTKATILSPRGSRLVGEILCELLGRRGAEAVGGLVLGSAFIATAVALASELAGRPIYGFVVRERQKDHGVASEVEQSFHPDGRPLLSPGRRVAVVDDVVTAGGSILKAIEAVREQGCEIVAAAAIVDRRAGGGERIRALGLPFFSLFETDERGSLAVTAAAAAAV